MAPETIVNGLIQYVMLVILLTFHEYAHAIVASICGDDTARSEGRCSLNPLVHIDPIGTVVLPLIMIFWPSAGQYLIGWAKPVPVNIGNLRNPRLDDILISMAGPWMNFLLAFVLVGLARLSAIFSYETAMTCRQAAHLSLLLCFFNLIPVPPLDGSRVLRSLTNMSYEAYAQFAAFGFIIIIVLLRIPIVSHILSVVTDVTLQLMMKLFGF